MPKRVYVKNPRVASEVKKVLRKLGVKFETLNSPKRAKNRKRRKPRKKSRRRKSRR